MSPGLLYKPQLVRVLSAQSQGTFPGLCFATMKPKIPYVVHNALSTCQVSALPHIFMIALRAEPTQPTAIQMETNAKVATKKALTRKALLFLSLLHRA